MWPRSCASTRTVLRRVAMRFAVLQHAAAVLQVAQAVEVIKMLLTESAERKRERILKKGSEDCDEEEEEYDKSPIAEAAVASAATPAPGESLDEVD